MARIAFIDSSGITHILCNCGREGFDMCECQDVQVESWRSMKGQDYNQFMGWVEGQLADRWSLGSRKYKSDVKGFQGNPLDHAIEEALDLVLYLFMEKRKQEHD